MNDPRSGNGPSTKPEPIGGGEADSAARPGGGPGVSRIEAFSDAVFALSLTLLVVATDVPKTFDDLARLMAAFVPFAACFALLCWLWWSHHAYFRRFGVADRATVVLNCALLFFLVFYVYPLKFVATVALAPIFGGAPPDLGGRRAAWLMWFYGGGFAGVSLVFAALYGVARHRLRRRGGFDADAYDAGTHELAWFANAAVAAISCACAFGLGPRGAPIAGFAYFLIGPAQAAVFWTRGARRARVLSRAPRSGATTVKPSSPPPASS
jgi:hypothetical protein